ncbi:MAG: acyl-CoA dehydrogenase family protein [Actinomycetota bacterium]|nr:acyl-CoA dehydrogenase family protein [Actinomycetota bacterium]
MHTSQEQPLVAAARALQPLVQQHAPSAQQLRHVPEGVVRAMAAAGLYRTAAPACFGGAEADPFTTIEVIEAISQADGSIGWALMIGIETVGIGGALMDRDMAAGLFAAHPDLVMCGALNPQGRARKVDGGWQVSGQWPFASGCHHADLFWGQCVVEDGVVENRVVENGVVGGTPKLIEVLVPRASYEIVDTWHVNGLRGTGSHDVRVTDLFVPDEMTTQVSGQKPRHDGPLYRMPPFTRLAYNKVGVATGIARSALDAFVELAEHKQPRLSSRALRERPRAQLGYAQAEAALRGARAFVFDAVGDVWDTVNAGGVADRRQRALVRLACSHACQEAIRAVELVHQTAGTSANFEDSPIGQARRDVAVVAQQLMVAPQFIEDAGRVLLGLDPAELIL